MWVVKYILREAVLEKVFSRRSEAEEFAEKIGDRLIELTER